MTTDNQVEAPPMILDNLNFLTLAVFAPILILIGILGFVIPEHRSPTSGAAAYNIFHIVSGAIGAIIVLIGHGSAIHLFNTVFGVVDLYQAAASAAGWFPKRHFRWTRIDDALHILVGLLLVGIGTMGR
ncbi:MAG: hypothetical protein ACKVX9_08725 [Blastocatellia bacterium]